MSDSSTVYRLLPSVYFGVYFCLLSVCFYSTLVDKVDSCLFSSGLSTGRWKKETI